MAALTLTEEQRIACREIGSVGDRTPHRDLPAPRRDGKRQDRGLPAGGGRGAARRSAGAGTGARDHPDPPDPRPRLRARFGDRSRCCTADSGPPNDSSNGSACVAVATPIAVGARSALFAPIEKLGVIVIDEEHDSAYKNDEGFRYHAREPGATPVGAVRRAARSLLGSATPALETRYAADRGQVRRLRIAERGSAAGRCPRWRSWTCGGNARSRRGAAA